ncbi:MAG: glycosyltransferase family 2 protein [Bauldia sp.]
MRVSVVTVCFNSARTIRSALESFFAQDHPDKELVVVDGASTDGTLAMVEAFAGEDLTVMSAPDRGIYDAMNKGLAAFSGDAVGFLNSDDRFKDGQVLSRIAAALKAADIVHGNLDFVSDHETGAVVRRWRSSAFRKHCFAGGWMPPHPTFYVRRAVVEAVGGFDLGYRTAADYDFMLRAMEFYDFRTTFVDSTLIDMRYGGDSTAGLRAYLRGNLEARRSRRTWLNAGIVDRAFFAKPLSKVTQFVTR